MNLSSTLYSTLLSHQDLYIGLLYFVSSLYLFLIPLYAYLIINKMPKSATIYKWLLSSCIFSSVISITVRTLWVPIPTLPLMGVYSAGIIESLGPKASLICMNIYFACTVNSQLCTTFCLIFQYSALKPFSWVSSFGYCPRRVSQFYIGYFILMVTILTVLLQISAVGQEEFAAYANMTGNFYALEIIKHQPSWIGFSAAIKPAVYAFAFFAIVPDCCIAIFAIFLTIKLYFIIKNDKAHVSYITRGLEKNLYYTFLFRTFLILFLFTIPYLGIVGSIFFEYVNPEMGIICHSVIILQGLTCLLGTLIMIKPFRVFIFRCFYRKLVRDSSTNSSEASSPAISVTFQSLPSIPSKRSI